MKSISLRSRRLLPLAIALALGVPAADAATITVTTGGDAGTASTCTLRQALTSANSDGAGTSSCVAGSGDDSIAFAANLRNSRITLANGPLQITSNVTVTGTGQTIDGNNASALLYIDPNVTTSLSYLTLTGGNSGTQGVAGGINIVSNQPPVKPGSPFASAAAARRSSPILHAPQPGQGTTLSHVTITGNTSKYVGGLLVEGGYTTLYECTVSNNTATGSAKGIVGGVGAFGSAVVAYGSTISGNTVPNGDVQPTGGIVGYYALVGLVDSTVAGNSAKGTNYVAGGVAQSSQSGGTKYGVVTLNSTISGNSATGSGANLAGGALIGGGSAYGGAYFVNSIVDGNTASSGTTPNIDIIGTSIVKAKYSLLGTELQTTLTGNHNVFAADPKLGPLANNGGPTQTRGLLPGSPAIDAGDTSTVSSIQYDQRGQGFPRVVGSAVDIGAFEGQVAAAATVPAPALSTWGAALLGGLLALFGIAKRRRRN